MCSFLCFPRAYGTMPTRTHPSSDAIWEMMSGSGKSVENFALALEKWGGVSVCELGGLSTPLQSRTSAKVI